MTIKENINYIKQDISDCYVVMKKYRSYIKEDEEKAIEFKCLHKIVNDRAERKIKELNKLIFDYLNADKEHMVFV